MRIARWGKRAKNSEKGNATTNSSDSLNYSVVIP